MKIIVLGAGLVGGPWAADLSLDEGFSVTVADRSQAALDRLAAGSDITCVRADLADPRQVAELVSGYDFVVDAMPGFLGFQTLQAVIAAGRNVIDIAFFPEDPFLLDDLAREKGVVAIMDCGVFPGMGSALVGRAARRLDTVQKVVTYVGGLPEIRQWPWEYKAVFSPVDVIEEYTRPARFLERGALVTRPALSDVELMDFPGVGTLESFNTDGLRTLLHTIAAPDMKEKTLRYPGHVEKMRMLRDTGFFSEETVDVGGRQVRPLDLTASLLFPQWQLGPDEGDITVMQIVVEGRRDGRTVRYRYDLLDRWDRTTGTTSMARTTGYTATCALRLVAQGLYSHKGVSPPEYLGRQRGCVPFLLEGLAARGVHYTETVETDSDLK
jgi:lysine 6-dehydrogenase